MHSEGLFGAVRHVGLIALYFEVELQDLAQRLFVVDHKDFVFCHKFGFESVSKLRNIHGCYTPPGDI